MAWLAGVALLGGCAGVSIESTSPARVAEAHTDGKSLKGYVVYSPMIVMDVGEKELCVKRAADGSCSANKTICSIGSPTVLPDYAKPFLVSIQSGFGKAGVEVQIADGWRLSGVKDSSDNTALVGFLEKALGLGTAQAVPPSTAAPCGTVMPGLYRWDPTKSPVLTRMPF